MIKIRTVKKILKWLYRTMQTPNCLFRLLVFLEKTGIVECLMVMFSKIGKDPKQTEEKRKSNKAFFDSHIGEIGNVIELLEDQESREVYEACIAYRTRGIPIPRNLFCERNQYLVNGIIDFSENEVIVDCGAFIGDTVRQYIDVLKKKKIKNYKIIAFEPSERNGNLIKKHFLNNKHVHLITKGVSDNEKILFFKDDGSKSRIVNDQTEATTSIELTALDLVKECADASYIKMDIEGAEVDALKGAEHIIVTKKPKLAICIYHSNEDMVRIPLYIKKLMPTYKLYIRHHSRGHVETVLYAI